MFTIKVTVYSRRSQGGFVNSTFPLQTNFPQKSTSTCDKQKIQANLNENSKFQLNATEKTTEKRRLTSSNRATPFSLTWIVDR